ncbi:YpzI family protein [Peribacillus asahii]
MGKDRQEKKLKQSRRVESDRDQSLHYSGSTRLENPEESRKRNEH